MSDQLVTAGLPIGRFESDARRMIRLQAELARFAQVPWSVANRSITDFGGAPIDEASRFRAPLRVVLNRGLPYRRVLTLLIALLLVAFVLLYLFPATRSACSLCPGRSF